MNGKFFILGLFPKSIGSDQIRLERTPLVGAQPNLPQQAQPSEVIISVDPNAKQQQEDLSRFWRL
jgi:hypothetical protein